MKLVMQDFKGIAPRRYATLLPDNFAQTAENCKLDSGRLEAWDQYSAKATLTKTGTIQTIYLLGSLWLHWTAAVEVALAPQGGSIDNRFYYTGDTTPKKSNATLAAQGGTSYPMVSYPLGVAAPTLTPTVSAGAGGSGDDRDMYYCFTYVTSWGEEGAPSPVSAVVTAKNGQSVTVGNLGDTYPTGYANITNKRIYRSATGTGTNAEWLFVAEVAIATTSYADSTLDAALGEALSTEDNYEPPAALKGIRVSANGVFFGYDGKTIYASKAYQPYAWPDAYENDVPYTITGIEVLAQGVVVLTEAFPYISSGIDPESMVFTRLPEQAPCVSARSVVPTRYGVLYASQHGLYLIKTDGTGELVTRELMSSKDWKAYNPSSIRGVMHNGKYYGFYDAGGGDEGCIVFDLDNRQELTTLSLYTSAAFVIPTTDTLCFYQSVDTTNYVREWQGDDTQRYGSYTWKSKVFLTPVETNFNSIRIYGEWGDLAEYYALVQRRQELIDFNSGLITTGEVGGGLGEDPIGVLPVNGDALADVPAEPIYAGDLSLTVKVYANGSSVYEEAGYMDKARRLPKGFRAKRWEVELVGNVPVERVEMSTNVEELKGQGG